LYKFRKKLIYLVGKHFRKRFNILDAVLIYLTERIKVRIRT